MEMKRSPSGNRKFMIRTGLYLRLSIPVWYRNIWLRELE
jgi:hypothetical protein